MKKLRRQQREEVQQNKEIREQVEKLHQRRPQKMQQVVLPLIQHLTKQNFLKAILANFRSLKESLLIQIFYRMISSMISKHHQPNLKLEEVKKADHLLSRKEILL